MAWPQYSALSELMKYSMKFQERIGNEATSKTKTFGALNFPDEVSSETTATYTPAEILQARGIVAGAICNILAPVMQEVGFSDPNVTLVVERGLTVE